MCKSGRGSMKRKKKTTTKIGIQTRLFGQNKSTNRKRDPMLRRIRNTTTHTPQMKAKDRRGSIRRTSPGRITSGCSRSTRHKKQRYYAVFRMTRTTYRDSSRMTVMQSPQWGLTSTSCPSTRQTNSALTTGFHDIRTSFD
jgi:hypothetical protein